MLKTPSKLPTRSVDEPKYSTSNLGDEIQSIAASQYLPRIDRLLNRDLLSFTRSDQSLHVIYNGWFLHTIGGPLELRLRILEKSTSHKQIKAILKKCIQRFERLPFSWPPSRAIHPLLISMHFARDKEAFRRLTRSELKSYYNKFGPIGCRDMFTLRLLQEMGVEAYFSGCLTMTFTPQVHRREEQIFFVDVPG